MHLKEGRPLVIAPRETPFNLIHLRNLTALAEAGARIAAPIPAWYTQPKTLDDMVDFLVIRLLDGLERILVPATLERTNRMKSLQRLLLVPCLAPFVMLAVLLIAASTPRSTSRIQLLVWNTSPQPIGAWMALAGLAGAGLSGLSALALMPRPPRLRRRLHQPVDAGPWAEAEASPPPQGS